uniref:Bee-milk protein n=1 Tax=Megaselia scalaris TaxID=36166 RepID=T1GGU7_MEGSC
PFSTFVFSWELSSIGIHNFTLLHSKTFVLRVFLCILPSKSLNNTVRIPTLVESTWPENYFSLLPKIFPYKQLHSISENQKGDCSLMHQALQTELDDLYRLWVLDEGNDKCPPKIFIFDLLRDNRKVATINCENLFQKKLISMELDPYSACHSRYEMYITVKDEKNEVPGLTTRINPTYITFLGVRKIGQFYTSDRNGNLYYGNNKMYNQTENIESIVIRKLGVLLGEPKSLVLDLMGMLYYIVDKFGIVVRVTPYKGVLKAEEHEILYFSQSEAPLTQVIFGSMGSVWAVTSNFVAHKDHCNRILYHFMLQSNTSEII